MDAAARNTPDRLSEVLARLRVIVGDRHALADKEVLERYSRDLSPWERTCAVVVYPGCTEEVRAVVKVAAEHGIPVWPFSKGKNWGYGATVAWEHGAIVVLLERMNRIIEVNEELAYAVIEPGVTQKQLNDHLKQNNIKLWADCTDSTPHGSVLGNALERGVGYTRYGDHFGHLCGLEVVLPTGEVIRTGGGPANAQTWHTYKYGTGPYIEGLFSQSNLGIVTQAGVWLMPEPETFTCFFCEVRRAEDLPDVVDALRRLALTGAVQSNVHLVNDYASLFVLRRYPYELLQGRTHLSPEVRAALRRQYHIAPFTLTGGLYGSAAQVRASRARIRQELWPLGKLTFLDDRRVALLRRLAAWVSKTRGVPVLSALARLAKRLLLSPAPLEVLEVVQHVYPIYKGIPGDTIVTRAEYFKCRRPIPAGEPDPIRDRCGLLWFAPAVPMTGTHLKQILGICEPLFDRHGFDFSLAFILLNPRTFVALMEICYDRDNPAESARAVALHDDLTEQTMRVGYQQYRIGVAYSDRVLGGAPEYRQVMDAIKSALDPVGILAPGRYGVGLPPAPTEAGALVP
jgi:4-cresol dehydrogenase (hydroxylating)